TTGSVVPSLEIRISGQDVLISASTSLAGYEFLAKEDLSDDSEWTVVTSEATFLGNAFVIPYVGSRFYRLQRRGIPSVTFAPGETSKSIVIAVNGDTLNEADETFFVNLSNAANATIGDAQGVVTIVNDDLPPALSISDAAVTEGDSGTVPAVFRVSLSAVSSLAVTVDYSTASDTALAGSDFVATSGRLTFAPGETNQTISVEVKGDTIAEATESFLVNLSNATNASISDGQGVGFITDNDALPTIVITDAAVTEGDSTTTNAVFSVSLSAISGQVVTVDFVTADDTATAGSDYQPVSGTLTFNPAETNKTITVVVIGDFISEATERFLVNLTNIVNAVLTDSQAKGTITDNDPMSGLSISDVSVTEGNSGTTNAVLTVNLSAASALPVSVNWTTANGTASAPADYLANSGTLTFAAGQTIRTIAIVLN